MTNRKHKFKVGDRVIYRCRGQGGNGWIDGYHGTVKHISDYQSHYDYDVEFDQMFPDSLSLDALGIKRDHGWSCTEEHLDSEDGSDEEDEDPDIKKQKKEEGITMGRRAKTDSIDWAKADYILRDKRSKGESFEKIGETPGCSKDMVRNRYRKLVTIGFIKENGHACEKQEGETVAGEENKVELNELEETLAAVITEQKEEIDYLQGRVRGLEMEVATRTEEAMEAKRMAVIADDRAKGLEDDLEDARNAVEIAEESMDEERQQKELLVKELSAAREALEAKELDCMDGIHEMFSKYDARIKELTEERDRYLELAVKLAEGLVGL